MENKQVSLIELFKVFLTIGTIGFGGGMAIIALMQDYCVNRKKWLSNDEFVHGVALGQFMGPFAVNASIFVGCRLRGFKGAVVSSVSFLAPSVVIVILLSALYLKFHQLPSMKAALNGVAPAAIALILSVAYSMVKDKMKSVEPVILMLVTICLSVFFKVRIVIILLIGLIYGIIKLRFLNKVVNDEKS